ncbi:MAG: phospholipase [Chlamydiae bacterium]|nr:MAG: phospholipase [Chlamydiota bacterium]
MYKQKLSFINPYEKNTRRDLKDILLWKLGYYDNEKLENCASFNYPVSQKQVSLSNSFAIWINHSTFLIEIDGLRILTDPIWSKRCSPLSFLGPKRRHPPGVSFSQLPTIHLILISHDHYDHLDKPTVLALAKHFPQTTWMVPQQVKSWFDAQEIFPVYQCQWWQERVLGFPNKDSKRIKITAVPAQHFSGRKHWSLNNTLWVGWVMEFYEKDQLVKKIYFVGDTGYNPVDFKQIGEHFSPIDLSLIPIGSYSPRSFMRPVHINPEEAVMIHQEVGSKLSIGMHWKTFCLSDEPMNRPPYDLYMSLKKHQIDPSSFLALPPGYAINF